MPKRSINEEENLIEAELIGCSDGIGIARLEDILRQKHALIFNRRTLQRRLQKLIDEGRAVTKGAAAALVYKATPKAADLHATSVPSSAEVGAPQIDQDIPVSEDGAVIRDHVRQPLMMRRPVGYNRRFLDEYEAGVTFYLPQNLRKQLHEIGRTSGAGRPAGTYARDILDRLLVDLSWASSRLEGNTYNRLDTQNLIEFGQVAEGKDIVETQMILNHKAAIEMLIEDAQDIGFDVFTFQNLHAILSENLMRDDAASGRIRRRPVEVSGTVFQPLAMPQVLEECFRTVLTKTAAIPDPFEQAFFLMVHLPYLQPFEDVNKRVSRIGVNIPLIKNNLCPLSFIDVPERSYVEGTLGVYELNRVELLRDVFVWAYERSCQRYLAITQSMGEPDPIKIRYRDVVTRVVQTIVRGNLPPSIENVQGLISDLVPEKDRSAVVSICVDALQNLHEGSVSRYRLKRDEFFRWHLDHGSGEG
ncbi:MAG: Fic family protein [Desulfobacterium sp.]